MFFFINLNRYSLLYLQYNCIYIETYIDYTSIYPTACRHLPGIFNAEQCKMFLANSFNEVPNKVTFLSMQKFCQDLSIKMQLRNPLWQTNFESKQLK